MLTFPIPFKSAQKTLVLVGAVGFAALTIATNAKSVSAQTSGAIAKSGTTYYVSGAAAINGDVHGNDVVVGENTGGQFVSGAVLTVQNGAYITANQTDGYGLRVYGTNTVRVQGGFTSFLQAVSGGAVEVSGGQVSELDTYGTSSASLTGGSAVNFTLFESSSALVSGGDFGGNTGVEVADYGSGNVMFSGTGLTLTPTSSGTYQGRDGIFYTLTGRLSNNAASGTYQLFDATQSGSTGTFIIANSAGAPEPAALALLLPALLPLIAVGKRRCQNRVMIVL